MILIDQYYNSHIHTMRMQHLKKIRGFTLIELLMVIAIISLITSVVLASLTEARQKAKIARTYSDLIQLRNAIHLMKDDTGSWPNGCESVVFYGAIGDNNEAELDSQRAGLSDVSPIETSSGACQWSSAEVAAWNGPYIKSDFKDPWGEFYWFDNDYEAYQQCDSVTIDPGTLAVVVSFGPTGRRGSTLPFSMQPDESKDGYDCDDIFIQL